MKKLILFVMMFLISMNSYADVVNKSKIEEIYQKELNNKNIRQYGYSMFNSKNEYTSTGGVQDDYVLGIGDELNIYLTGGKIASYETYVNKQGQVVVDELVPISVNGLTLSEFENILKTEVSKLYLDTSSHVVLNKLKMISVSIMGEVNKPGSYNIGALSTVTDLIYLAEGIKKSGSLRKIQVISKGEKKEIDLYELLSGDKNFIDLKLKQNDKVIISTIGDTIAVVGDAKYEAIFELKGNNTKIIEEISGIKHSDNIEIAKIGNASVMIISNENNKSEIVEVISNDKKEVFSINNSRFLSNLLIKMKDNDKKKIYPFFAIIERFDANSLATDYVLFNPSLILKKHKDIKLKALDKVVLFTKDNIKELQNPSKDEETSEIIANYKHLFENNSVSIYGEVLNEGLFPMVYEVLAKDLIGISGGLLPSAVKDSIEVIKNNEGNAEKEIYSLEELSSKVIKLSDGDTMRIKSKFDMANSGVVSITGEIKYPGKYSFSRGEKLSTLIKRAGGLTDEAYSYGTVYSRESARIKEKQLYKQTARSLEKSLAEYMASEKNPNHKQIEYTRDLITKIEKTQPLGRIVVEANPEILENSKEEDVLLQDGDKIYVPKRALTVHVMGEVLNPSSLKFKTGKKAHEYIENSGGYSFYADKDRGFILLPDGSSKPINDSSWNFAKTSVPEGSTIIIPKDPDPFSFAETSLFITNVLSQIAITTASIADIKD